MLYTVVIFDQTSKEFIMAKGFMTGTGLVALLKHMTNLNRDGRNAFMYELQRTRTSSYIPDSSAELQYSVAAVEGTE